jgi:hypothetical protein
MIWHTFFGKHHPEFEYLVERVHSTAVGCGLRRRPLLFHDNLPDVGFGDIKECRDFRRGEFAHFPAGVRRVLCHGQILQGELEFAGETLHEVEAA